MAERDVIIAAFACGGKMNCKAESKKFKEIPIIINVPGGSSSGFKKTAQAFRAKNSILNQFLLSRKELKNVKIRRVCLLSFSAGWAWSTEVLRAKKDLERIDTVIVMDGIHTPNLKAWNAFAGLASIGGLNAPKLWMAHTQIKPPFISAKTTNSKIMGTLYSENTTGMTIPEYIWKAELENTPISVYSKIESPKNKLYHKDPLLTFEHIGNAARFEYEGGRAQDHIFNAQYTQPRFWRWLREVWTDPEHGVHWE